MENYTNEEIKKTSYFANRNVREEKRYSYRFPKYLRPFFQDSDRTLNILDIGCGLGQMLTSLKTREFINLYGIDINEESINACKSHGLNVEKISDIREYAKKSKIKFDRIIMSHVLEHLNKDSIIETLAYIKKYLLSENGFFFLNSTQCTIFYWCILAIRRFYSYNFIYFRIMPICTSGSGLFQYNFPGPGWNKAYESYKKSYN